MKEEVVGEKSRTLQIHVDEKQGGNHTLDFISSIVQIRSTEFDFGFRVLIKRICGLACSAALWFS